jgi:hypothetical protein
MEPPQTQKEHWVLEFPRKRLFQSLEPISPKNLELRGGEASAERSFHSVGNLKAAEG